MSLNQKMYSIFFLVLILSCNASIAQKTTDIKQVEKEAAHSLHEVFGQLYNPLYGADFAQHLQVTDIKKGETYLLDAIKKLEPFKNLSYIKNSLNELNKAKKSFAKLLATTNGLERQSEIQMIHVIIIEVWELLERGEVPTFNSKSEAKKDFFNRVEQAKKSFSEALQLLKLKDPKVKDAYKIIAKTVELLRPWPVKKTAGMLTLYALPQLEKAMETKDKLEKLRNAQHAILSIVYAEQFLDETAAHVRTL